MKINWIGDPTLIKKQILFIKAIPRKLNREVLKFEYFPNEKAIFKLFLSERLARHNQVKGAWNHAECY